MIEYKVAQYVEGCFEEDGFEADSYGAYIERYANQYAKEGWRIHSITPVICNYDNDALDEDEDLFRFFIRYQVVVVYERERKEQA